MPRRNVQFSPGVYYHLYNRGNNRDRIFYERENYLFFLRRLRKHILPVLDIVAYCLMPTHYHLLASVKKIKTSEFCQNSEVSTGVSRAMQRLSISYTKAMNKRYDRVGALFQGAFQAKHVDEDTYLLHLSRYVHLNPVIAGLVEQAEDWEFSSYQEYIGLRDGTLPKPEIVLSQFPSLEAYREFVGSDVTIERGRIAHLLFD
jgi:REP element-mobilizing transposase RayT